MDQATQLLVRVVAPLFNKVAKQIYESIRSHANGDIVSATDRQAGWTVNTSELERFAVWFANDLEQNELSATVYAVTDALEWSDIQFDDLLLVNLDARALKACVIAKAGDIASDRKLNEKATVLFDRLLALLCHEIVKVTVEHPDFQRIASVEELRRSGEILAQVNSLAESMVDTGDRDFRNKYKDVVVRTLGRLQVYGVTFVGTKPNYGLSTAYLSLAMSLPRIQSTAHEGNGIPSDSIFGQTSHAVIPTSLDDESEKLEHRPNARVRIEEVLTTSRRLHIRGTAGSGKTTLLQWVAVNAVRDEVPIELRYWSGMIPFFLPLRRFTGESPLPAPEQFLANVGRMIAGSMPPGWVNRMLNAGLAIILIDGVDEVPTSQRQRVREWLTELIGEYSSCRYIVTSRPSATDESWVSELGFQTYDLLPMGSAEVRKFIERWHAAAREECDQDEIDDIDGYESALLDTVATEPQISRLATNPLLCALICALNRDRRTYLPRRRKEVYDAALEMLLLRRDAERRVGTPEGVELGLTEQRLLLERLAYWMIRNGLAEADRENVIEQLELTLSAMPHLDHSPQDILRHLVRRSGVLREPTPGRIDFLHRTFEDFLGAKAAVDLGDIQLLISNAHDDAWQDVVIMAVVHARANESARLLRGLMQRGKREADRTHRLHLLAAAALEQASEVDPRISEQVRICTGKLLPPKDMSDVDKVAAAGEFVVRLLAAGADRFHDPYTAAATIRAVSQIGGVEAMPLIAKFARDRRSEVQRELLLAWRLFDLEEYARTVLSVAELGAHEVSVDVPSGVNALPFLANAKLVVLDGDLGDLNKILGLRSVTNLELMNNRLVRDLTALCSLTQLRSLTLNNCPNVDLDTLSGSVLLEELVLPEPEKGSGRLSVRALTRLPKLRIEAHHDHIDGIDDFPKDRIKILPGRS